MAEWKHEIITYMIAIKPLVQHGVDMTPSFKDPLDTINLSIASKIYIQNNEITYDSTVQPRPAEYIIHT